MRDEGSGGREKDGSLPQDNGDGGHGQGTWLHKTEVLVAAGETMIRCRSEMPGPVAGIAFRRGTEALMAADGKTIRRRRDVDPRWDKGAGGSGQDGNP